ncbi:GDP-mannose 4,6-dehydratase [Patescibacteria group bacterium AH-259-L05]|nr:GDP-mannose 4,6-dehydratase [Patescibacteria group bacterium AH-259-L05]
MQLGKILSILPKKQKFYPGKVKNILVTGGAGFLGSHVCDRLVEQGNVICIDNFTGVSDITNVKHLLQKPNFHFIKHDINEPIDFEQFPELASFKINIHGISEMYHFACPTSVKKFDELKMQTLYTNSLGTLTMLEIAKFYKAKIVFASSSVIYGQKGNNTVPFKESDPGQLNSVDPRACYDEGKRFSETAMATYRGTQGVDTKIVRIFRTYGPRQPLFDGQMVPDFILQALNNKPLVIYGDESFSTSLCYVDDVIEGIMGMMASGEAGPINIGGPQAHKLIDLAKKIIELTGSSSEIIFKSPLSFMRPLGIPDVGLAKEKLEWFPVTSLHEGLKKMIEYAKAHRMLLRPMVGKYDQE